MKHRLFILVILLLSIDQATWAYDFSYTYQGHTLYYTIINSSQRTVKVVNPLNGNYSSYVTGDLVIPQHVYNNYTYRVTSIDERAFSNCSGLTSVSIPNSVTQIGKYAFYQCNNMTSVSIGNGVTRIDDYSFQQCSSLDSLDIPNGVTYIGWSSFAGCSGLTSLTIGTGVTLINILAFSGCSSLTSVVFNAINCTYAGNFARPSDSERSFANCTNITNFTFGDNVEVIPDYLCEGMPNITTITIPNSVTTIGNMAFYNCSGLTSIAIGNSVSNISGSAFSRCNGVTSIVVATGNTHYDSRNNCNALIQTDLNLLIFGCQTTVIPNTITSIGSSAFSQCGGLTAITIPNSVTSIGSSAFQNCTGLSSVVIGNSVTSIDNQAFSGCSGLTSVTIPNSVISIGKSAFSNCSGLTSVSIGNLVSSIGSQAFSGCSGLTSATIPSSVTTIGNQVFSRCINLTSIIVEDGNTHYDSRENCNAIIRTDSNCLIQGCKTTVIPNTVAAIGNGAFHYCSELTSMTIPNNVISIGDYAFYGCSGLTSIIIPDSVTTIGEYAFANCSLESIILGKSMASLGYRVFYCYGCYAVQNLSCKATIPPNINSPWLNAPSRIFVPCNEVQVYQNASGWNSYSGRVRDKNFWEHTYVFAANNDSIGSVNYGEPDCDSNIVVTANVMDGNLYHFIGWSDGILDNPRIVHLTGDTSLVAIFDYIPYLIIGQSNDNDRGIVMGSDTVHYLDVVSLEATANYGYHFTMWNDGVTDNPRQVQVTRDSVFTAQFDYNQYSIALAVDATVHGTVSGAGSNNYLSERTISATPNYGYHFTMWSDGVTDNPRTFTLTQDTAFTAQFAKNTYSIVALSADTMKGTVTGTDSLEYLDTATLTATANYGYHFMQWSDGVTDNPRLVQVTRDSVFTALFDNNQYSIALAVDATVHGTVSGAGVYNYLSERAISATPNYGYHFTMWSDGDTNNPRTLTLTQDTALTALFAKNTYSITVLSADTVKGSASGTGTLEYLDTATLTATANYGYHFTQWSDGNTDNPRQVQVTRDSVFTAQFDYNQYSIALVVDTTIHGTVSGAGVYNYLSEHTINATPNYGYHFTMWSDGNTNNPRTLTLTQDTVFTALFDKNTYSIVALSADTLKGTVTGTNSLEYLDTTTLTATANYGYHFTMWNDGNTDNPRQVQVTRDSVFTAQFDYNQYSIALAVDTTIHGTVSGAGVYNYLSERAISATPNYGYHFIMWNDGDTNNPRTLTLTRDTAFTALFAKNTYNIAVLSADTVMGAVDGTSTLEYLDTATLTATANYGYHFTMWSDGNTDNPRQVQVTRDSVFTAQFDYNLYSIALAVDTTIHGTVSGAGDYNYLSTRIITATPNYGYHFVQWNDGDTNNPRTLTLTQDTAFTALFAKNTYSITALSTDTVMGAVAGTSTLEYLDTATLTATAHYGYHFTQWSDGNTANPRMVQVTRDSVFTAQFDYNQYSIALAVDTTIHGTVSGAGDYNYLSSRTITATANYGYHFTMWNDGDTNNPRTLTLTRDTAFTALFANNEYTLTLGVNDTMLGTVTGGGNYSYLDTVILTATCTAPHHHFVQWNDGITDASRSIIVVGDTAYNAIFAIDTHSVTLAVNDDLLGSVNGAGDYPYGTQVTIEATSNDGYHFAEWSNGSRENPLVISLEGDTAITAIFTDDVVPQICMVTVQDGRNMVMWEKGLEVLQYNLYREGMTAGEYELAASVPYDSLSVWVDTASRPRTRSYRYRLTATDIFGIESEPSEIHKTMHLTINQGLGNEWNLVWSEYEGADYSTYVIYRGTDASNIQQIDVMPAGGNTTYTDENAPTGEVYYQVGILLNTPCNPAKSSTIVLSNIATNVTVGISETADRDNNIRIYTENGRIYVNRDGQTVNDFYVYDVVGREIYHARQENHTSILPEGVYLVKVGIYPARKVVVIR